VWGVGAVGVAMRPNIAERISPAFNYFFATKAQVTFMSVSTTIN